MSYIIAITGKGGVGKTTISGLIANCLLRNGCKPILAVDADPNTCLDSALGVKALKTVGGIREETRQIAEKGLLTGVSKQELLELKISESLIEADGFDLIAMGRPEGPGCYCYANNVLKTVISKISSQYPYVLLDNEAGLENLSRRIVQNVNLLIVVADPSNVGLETAIRLHSLAGEMNIKYDSLAVIINRMRNEELPKRAEEIKEATKADIVLGLTGNTQLAMFAEEGKSMLEIPEDNEILKRIDEFVKQIIKGS